VRRRPFACELRDTDLQLQQAILARKSSDDFIRSLRRISDPDAVRRTVCRRRLRTPSLHLVIEQPAFGPVRVANELRKRGLTVSPAGVRCVWQRYDLETMKKRLKALEAKSAQESLVMTKAQLIALEGQDREGGPWRVRERASRLLRECREDSVDQDMPPRDRTGWLGDRHEDQAELK
jgi:hypothetical protein